LNQNRNSGFQFGAFSPREPVFTSLENVPITELPAAAPAAGKVRE
jgi:hypothetical protein